MPEITAHDDFGRAIATTILSFGYRSGIEIGSWDGSGSTSVIVAALSRQPQPRLVAIESVRERHERLAERFAETPWVEAYHGSSISAGSLTPRSFADVWNSPHNRLAYPEDQVRGWWDQFIEYMDSSPAGDLEAHPADSYDFALLDGSEFTGLDEFRLLRGRVRCFMLDDVYSAYKCAQAHDTLAASPEWACVWCSAFVRNGSSIWVKR
jgi:hypothetical protein